MIRQYSLFFTTWLLNIKVTPSVRQRTMGSTCWAVVPPKVPPGFRFTPTTSCGDVFHKETFIYHSLLPLGAVSLFQGKFPSVPSHFLSWVGLGGGLDELLGLLLFPVWFRSKARHHYYPVIFIHRPTENGCSAISPLSLPVEEIVPVLWASWCQTHSHTDPHAHTYTHTHPCKLTDHGQHPVEVLLPLREWSRGRQLSDGLMSPLLHRLRAATCYAAVA